MPSYSTEPARAGWQDVGDIWGLPFDEETGVWPRFMTRPHPRAVGTLGWEFIEWAEAEGQRLLNPKRSEGLRWWQKAVALRALEVDEEGYLVWGTVLITVARQSGKSWLMRCLLAWRLVNSERFGETQTLLHVAHKLQGAYEVWRPATRWAIANWGQKSVRFANGEQSIQPPDGARWLVQAANDGAGVSMSLGLCFVDEAWRVKREIVDGAIMPTMAEAAEPQLFLVSTAGDWDSDLMVTYRDLALGEVDAPDSTLLLEWSARPEDRVDDRDAWRAASPHWSPRRHAVVLKALGSATEAEFRSQWLNQWQPSVDESQALVSAGVWDAAARHTLPAFGDEFSIVVEVEDNFGDGACVALAWCDPDSSLIAGRVELVKQLPEAWLRVAEYRERWPNCQVQVGATLAADPLLVDVVGIDGAAKVGTTETRAALPLVRELIAQRRLVHEGGLDLRTQMLGLRVRAGVGGGLGIVGIDERRSDAARSFARAVLSAHRSVGIAPEIW